MGDDFPYQIKPVPRNVGRSSASSINEAQDSLRNALGEIAEELAVARLELDQHLADEGLDPLPSEEIQLRPAGSGAGQGAQPRTFALQAKTQVSEEDRAEFERNYQLQQRAASEERATEEEAFARSMRGRMLRFPLTSWMFDRRSSRFQAGVLAGAFIILGGLGLSQWFSSKEFEASLIQKPVELVNIEDSLGAEMVAGRGGAERLTRAFFAAESSDEMLQLIRAPEVLKPVVTKWYETNAIEHPATLSFGEVRLKELDERRYFLQQVFVDQEVEARPIAVELTTAGPKIDWETAVDYQSIPWESFQEERPEGLTYLRVIARYDNYYNFQFEDRESWVCLRLSHPNHLTSLYGYVKRQGALAQAFAEALPDDAASEYFILGLRFPKGAQVGDQVYIDTILQEKWVVPYKEGDRHFDLKP